MRIVRAPLRISLFGGGTDFPSFYQVHGATIVSFALDLYMSVIWNRRPTGGCRLSYSTVEELGSLTTAKHTLIKAAAVKYGFEEPCTLTIVSDVPAGTGLGSSSALAVCLCKLVRAHESGYHLVKTALDLERSVSNVGIQDHLSAYLGGFRIYRLQADKVWSWTEALRRWWSDIEKCGSLFYTGGERQAAAILPAWERDEAALLDIKALADDTAAHLNGMTLEELGRRLDQTWQIKRRIPGVTNDVLDAQYQIARNAGAYGGKLLGAGGCGCWFFLAEPGADIQEALGLPRLPFHIAREGVRERELW